jgi:predicted metal-dependent hydrolase
MHMPIEISQIIRSKRRTLSIQIKNDGSLIVRAPNRATNTAILEFVEKHAAWIQRKQTEARSAVLAPAKQYIHGEKFLFLGKPCPLEIVKRQKQPLLFDGNFKLKEAASHRAQLVFERWYREQARKILQERVDLFANQYGFQYQDIKINSARTRWGSCSAKGSLNFSWRLILAPLERVDYVVVHELVHTVHHNHSKRFWSKVATILPDYKERKKWFRQHGSRLMV